MSLSFSCIISILSYVVGIITTPIYRQKTEA